MLSADLASSDSEVRALREPVRSARASVPFMRADAGGAEPSVRLEARESVRDDPAGAEPSVRLEARESVRDDEVGAESSVRLEARASVRDDPAGAEPSARLEARESVRDDEVGAAPSVRLEARGSVRDDAGGPEPSVWPDARVSVPLVCAAPRASVPFMRLEARASETSVRDLALGSDGARGSAPSGRFEARESEASVREAPRASCESRDAAAPVFPARGSTALPRDVGGGVTVPCVPVPESSSSSAPPEGGVKASMLGAARVSPALVGPDAARAGGCSFGGVPTTTRAGRSADMNRGVRSPVTSTAST